MVVVVVMAMVAMAGSGPGPRSGSGWGARGNLPCAHLGFVFGHQCLLGFCLLLFAVFSPVRNRVLALVSHEGAEEGASHHGDLAAAHLVAAKGAGGTAGQGAREASLLSRSVVQATAARLATAELRLAAAVLGLAAAALRARTAVLTLGEGILGDRG